jgi:DNA-binding XRE family transcriptional regulator
MVTYFFKLLVCSLVLMSKQPNTDKIHDEIIKSLKKLREERGYSHQKLADLVGISRPAISFIESGKRKPTLSITLRIVAALGVKLWQILKETE